MDQENYQSPYEMKVDVEPKVDDDGFKHWHVFELYRGKPVLNIPKAMALVGNPEFVELQALTRQKELTEFYRKQHQEIIAALSGKVVECRRHTEILDEAFNVMADIIKQYDQSMIAVGPDLGDSINVFARSFLKLYGPKDESKIQGQ